MSAKPLNALSSLRRAAAFTLIEIVISLAVLGTMASGCYIGFNAVNTYAVSSRLYSEALTAAQNHTDLILSKEPFDVMVAYISGSFDPAVNKIPVELMTIAELDSLAGTVTFPTSPPTSKPAVTSPYYPYYPYYRTAAGTPLKKEAFIYQDPTSGTVLVRGTLSATVVDAGFTMSFVSATPTKLNTRKATIAVTYTYRNHDYDVSIDTLRTADQ